MRRKLAAGNWKMNGDAALLGELAQLANGQSDTAPEILILTKTLSTYEHPQSQIFEISRCPKTAQCQHRTKEAPTHYTCLSSAPKADMLSFCITTKMM